MAAVGQNFELVLWVDNVIIDLHTIVELDASQKTSDRVTNGTLAIGQLTTGCLLTPPHHQSD